MYLASGSIAVIIWILLFLFISSGNIMKRRKKVEKTETGESWATTLMEAMKSSMKELSDNDDESQKEQQSEREIIQNKQYDRAYEASGQIGAKRDDRVGKRFSETDRNGGDDASADDSTIRHTGRQHAMKRAHTANSQRGEVETRPFSDEYASLPEVATAQRGSYFNANPAKVHNTATQNFKAGKSSKGTKTHDGAIHDEISKSEISGTDVNSIRDEFDIRKAIIFSEIIKPKFEQERSDSAER